MMIFELSLTLIIIFDSICHLTFHNIDEHTHLHQLYRETERHFKSSQYYYFTYLLIIKIYQQRKRRRESVVINFLPFPSLVIN